MPRLDNTADDIIIMFGLTVDPADPGQTDPIDICNACAAWLGDDTTYFIEHPDYEDDVYHCAECGDNLTNSDN